MSIGGIGAAFSEALSLIAAFDHQVLEIALLSLQVSGLAVAIGLLIGLPAGACLAVGRFPGKQTLAIVANGFMGLPSVVVGVVVSCFCRARGP